MRGVNISELRESLRALIGFDVELRVEDPERPGCALNACGTIESVNGKRVWIRAGGELQVWLLPQVCAVEIHNAQFERLVTA